jgi:hypothetical protein
MSATANLDLEEIGGADFVDPAVFNRNSAKIDPLGKCYVTSSGTTGDWRWRKWSDGTAECWVENKAFATQSFTRWGSSQLYFTGYLSFGAFPFAFASVPVCNVVFQSCDESERTSYVCKKTSTSSTQSPSFFLVDVGTVALGNPHFGIHVIGHVS